MLGLCDTVVEFGACVCPARVPVCGTGRTGHLDWMGQAGVILINNRQAHSAQNSLNTVCCVRTSGQVLLGVSGSRCQGLSLQSASLWEHGFPLGAPGK